MSVHKHTAPNGKVTYEVRIPLPVGPDGKRKSYVSKGWPKESDAKRHERQQRTKLEKPGATLRGGRQKFGTYLTETWLPLMWADETIKPTTKADYANMAKHLLRDPIANVPLDQLEGDHLTLCYSRLRDAGKGRSLVRKVHIVANMALKNAKRVLPFNPADDAVRPPQSKPRPKAWTPEEIGAFLDVAADDRWAALWRLAAVSGKRRGEVVGLHWSDLDPDTGAWTVERNAAVADHAVVMGTVKQDRVGQIALDATTVAALRTWRKQQTTERLAGEGTWDPDRVWTDQDGKPVHPSVVSRTFNRLRDRAGIRAVVDGQRMTFHHLRHSWATNMLKAGTDIKTVSERLGHSSVRITYDMYVQPAPEADARAADLAASLYDAR